MKKGFSLLFAVFAVGIASLLLFTSADARLALFLQHFMSEKQSSVPLVLVSADDAFLQKTNSPFVPASAVEKCVSASGDLGALGFSTDFGFKNPVVSINSLVEKAENESQKETSLFNIKIVFPSKKHAAVDTKTPEIPYALLPFEHPSFSGANVFSAGNLPSESSFAFLKSRHLLVRKNGSYYADLAFSQILETLGCSSLKVTSSHIVLKNLSLPNGKMRDSLVLPRAGDGSLLFKFPNQSWHDYKTVSFSDLYQFSLLEENFYKYMKIMSERGLFGELNSENPLSVYESARAQSDRAARKSLKDKFYRLMDAYVSGNQEQILNEATTDEEKRAIITNSFATCRKLFSELAASRAALSEALNGAFCVFALTASSAADFAASPFDAHFPKTLVPFVLSHMLFAEDFVSVLPSFVSVLLALVLCAVFALLSLRIKKNASVVALSLLSLLLVSSLLVISAVCLRVFVAFSVPVFSLLLLSLFVSVQVFHENKKNRVDLANTFSRFIDKKKVKELLSESEGVSEAVKNEATVLASSIRNFAEIRALLNENQLVSFLNHYFDGIFSEIAEFGGIVESYRGDEIVALFGSPVFDEEHCANAVKAALAFKKCDAKLNEEIKTYPLSPKIDGMSDDLYTALFILNHNKKKIATQVGLFSGTVVTASLGASGKQLYRIIDDSWNGAGSVRDASRLFGTSGILLNETANDLVKNDYIIRNLNGVSEILGALRDDDEKLWNYAKYWNQAVDLLHRGEKEKSLAIFEKLLQGRPNDHAAKYFIKSINSV